MIQPKALETLPRGALFYPCSGNDASVFLDVFAGVVDGFWFADLVNGYGLQQERLGKAISRFELVSGHTEGKPCADIEERPDGSAASSYRYVERSITSEIYQDRATGERGCPGRC